MSSQASNSYIEMNGNLQFVLVENDPAMAQNMSSQLGKFGYRNTTTIANIYLAMEHIIHKKKRCEFIICRFKIGDLFATDLLDELKNCIDIQRVPILVFGHKIDEGDVALLEEKGADAYLTLPYISKEFAGQISRTWSRYIDPNHIEFKIEQVRRLTYQKQYSEAIKLSQALESKFPDFTHRLQYMQAFCLHSINHFEKAKKLCDQIKSQFEDFVHAFQLSGDIYRTLNNPEDALKAYSHAINLSPKNPFRYQVVSDILLNFGFWQEAKNLLEQAKSLNFDYGFINIGLAKSNLMLKEYQSALNIYLLLSEKDPKNSDYLNNISVCYKNLGDLNRAIQYYNKALAVDPENTKVMFNLALTYLKKDKPTKSIEILKQILVLDPKHERAESKILQITDPDEYKRKQLAKQESIDQTKAISTSQNEEEKGELTFTAESSISEESFLKIKSILEQSNAKKNSNTKIRTISLSEKAKNKIRGYDETECKYYYLAALMAERTRFHTFMHSWFHSVQQISEEIVDQVIQTLELIKKTNHSEDKKDLNSDRIHSKSIESRVSDALNELESHKQSDQSLYNSLLPLIQYLQFQDHSSQALNSIQKSFQISCTKLSPEQFWLEIKSNLISESAKKTLDQARGCHSESNDDSEESKLFFF